MRKINTVVVTGGAGFIGSAVIRQFIKETDTTVVNVDALIYPGKIGEGLVYPLTDGIEGSTQGVFVC